MSKKRFTRSVIIRSGLVIGGAAALAAYSTTGLAPTTPGATSATDLNPKTASTPINHVTTTHLDVQADSARKITTGAEDRAYWLDLLLKIADPVLTNLAQGTLKGNMPIEASPNDMETRAKVARLEAVGRLLAGIAPWLECDGLTGQEESLRLKYASLARTAIDAITNPSSPDYQDFSIHNQVVVDCAYLAHALLRAPETLWLSLNNRVQRQVVAALKTQRMFKPYFNNWILFSAIIETMLFWAKEQDWDPTRVEYALRQHEQWYKGDGFYGDGPEFHWDYYNSFVTHPMLIDILEIVQTLDAGYHDMLLRQRGRSDRYATILERLVAPDGTFPPIGRSIHYRFGAFQLLAHLAVQHKLPSNLPPAQVRSALNAVIRKISAAPGMFDENGWLTIGLYGHQPSLGENYSSTGSEYMCTMGLLPLGLPPTDEFWTAPSVDWSSKRIWSGQNEPADHF